MGVLSLLMGEIVASRCEYSFLKDKLNIVRITFTSGANAATAKFPSRLKMDRCPWCGIALKDGICPKCGYSEAR